MLARLQADPATRWQQPGAGKRVAVWEEPVTVQGIARPVRRVLRRIERDIDRRGRQLIVPGVELEGWATSLGAKPFDAAKSMALYADHGAHEQFHAEIKTDLDLARLPSGKFDTHYFAHRTACGCRPGSIQKCVGPDAPCAQTQIIAHRVYRLKTPLDRLEQRRQYGQRGDVAART